MFGVRWGVESGNEGVAVCFHFAYFNEAFLRVYLDHLGIGATVQLQPGPVSGSLATLARGRTETFHVAQLSVYIHRSF